jgi:hypothetical protein
VAPSTEAAQHSARASLCRFVVLLVTRPAVHQAPRGFLIFPAVLSTGEAERAVAAITRLPFLRIPSRRHPQTRHTAAGPPTMHLLLSYTPMAQVPLQAGGP